MRNIKNVASYVKEKMSGESTGHDWFHVERVLRTAIKISRNERSADLFIVKAAALLHDLGDWKINETNRTEEEIITKACDDLNISEQDADKILEIVLKMSYSKNVGTNNDLSLEGKIVQDADRLEALGAIGIARAFAYGGKKNKEIHNPNIKPQNFKSTSEYKSSKSTTINHFYEKLFKLRNLLNTKAAKKIALKREKFMKDFLKEFYSEWDGKL